MAPRRHDKTETPPVWPPPRLNAEERRRNLNSAMTWIIENNRNPQWDGKVVAFYEGQPIAAADEEPALYADLRRLGIHYQDAGFAGPFPIDRREKSHRNSDGRS